MFNTEFIHDLITTLGEALGKFPFVKSFNNHYLSYKSDNLQQKLAGVSFANPIGLAAGFDHEARLTQTLPSLGFGFATVGTITNMPYAGNPKPRLGRLPKSKSLMVNKGFKSTGAKNVAQDLADIKFTAPIGISIGRTNSSKLKTQKQNVADIVSAFKTFNGSNLKHSYYELNISCPNLSGDVTFYPPKNLEQLLTEIDKLKLEKPVFVKMPIELSNGKILTLLKVISKHSPKGVVFGNLQKDRKNKALVQTEVNKFKTGNFSGKPTYKRSNELISLTYKNYKNKLVIIGCGGVFTPADAYEKIKLGASLVQLITGIVYCGPQLASQINMGLESFLEKDGYSNITQAIGKSSEKV